MAPRDPSLPEGTDHIIDTNIDLGDTGGGSGGASAGGLGGGGTGSGGTTGAAGLGGGSGATSSTTGTSGTGGSSGTTGSSGTGGSSGTSGGSAFQFDKNGGGNSGGRASGIAGQVRDQLSTLKSQAGDRARGLADDGKTQATSFLQTVAQIVADASGSVEERLGGQYAGMGHRASSSINSLASTLDQRSVDDLIQDARSFVQRSPAVAIGVAAVLGFVVARVARSGISEYTGQSDTGTTGGNAMESTGGTGGGAGMPVGGSSGGLDATSGGFGDQGVGTAGTMGGSGLSTGPGSSGGTGNAPTI